MDEAEMLALLRDIESERVERKASLSDPDRLREAICAFANDLPGHNAPGVVFIGVSDDGRCAGTSITDELLLRIAQMRDEGSIVPIPTMSVRKVTLDGCEVAAVVVEPSPAPPVRFRGRTCIRVGPRRAFATPQEEQRLAERRRGGDLPFDLRPLPSATIADLDMELFVRTYLPAAVAPEVIEQNNRTVEDQLRSLRLLAPSGEPTVLGVLLLGKEPTRFIPGAYVQFLRIDGTELADPIRDDKKVDGPLPDLLRLLDDLIQLTIPVAVRIVGQSRDVRSPQYPPEAVRQLVRNAVLHRTYEGSNAPVRIYWFNDRVEILSPGGAFGQVNAENFGSPGVSDYRNPNVAAAMRDLGFIQRFGVGLDIARRALAENGNPAMVIDVEPTYVRVTLRPGWTAGVL
jgi:ATP-dependent DNA helicase RecG